MQHVAGLLAGWLLTYLLHSTVAIGSVWLIVRLGIARAPATRDLLWKLAAVVPLLTAPLALARPEIAVRRVEMHRVVAYSQDRTEVDTFRWRQGQSRLPVPDTAWAWLLVPAWLAGAGVGLGLEVRSRRPLRSDLGRLEPLGPRASRALAVAAHGVGREPRVAVSTIVPSPCVVGSLVVLPARCERELTEGELEAVLSHELAHVARRDGVWLATFTVLCRVLWIQPLTRVAREGFLEAADLECDDWSVARTRRPLDLARSISRVAEWSLEERGARPSPELALGRPRRLSYRVRRILGDRCRARGPRWKRLVAAATVLAPSLLLPAVPVATGMRTVRVQVEVTREAPATGVEGREARTVIVRRLRQR